MIQKTYDPQTAKFIAVVVENMPRMSADVMQRWIENPLALKKVLADLCLSEVIESKSISFITHNFLAIIFERTLKSAIIAGKYDWADNDITESNFPTNKDLFNTKKDMALFHFNKAMSAENVVEKINEAGYSPATLMELLAIGEKFPEIQREFPVIAFGSSARLHGLLRVPILWFDSMSGRILCLSAWQGVWLSSSRFLAVRKP